MKGDNFMLQSELLNMKKSIGTKLHRDRDIILDFCSKFEKIHIYGAGLCASRICNYLEEEKIDIEDIIVSDGHRKENKFLGRYEIKELSEMELSKNEGIIIALNSEHQEEVYNELIWRGISSKKIYKQKIYFQYADAKSTTDNKIDVRHNVASKFFDTYNELDQSGIKLGTDKSSLGHDYLNKYEFFLKNIKSNVHIVLELGVYKGASIKMWSQYFEQAMIYGVDIDEVY